MEKHYNSRPMSIIHWNTGMMFLTLYKKYLAMTSKSIEFFLHGPFFIF
jgi:hypothetical protein